MEKKLFNLLGLEAIKLPDCSFKNLQKYGIEIGTDCCPHVEDEKITCEECEYSELKEYYPEIATTFFLYVLPILSKIEILNFTESNSVEETKQIILSKLTDNLEKGLIDNSDKELLVDFLLNNCYIQYKNWRSLI